MSFPTDGATLTIAHDPKSKAELWGRQSCRAALSGGLFGPVVNPGYAGQRRLETGGTIENRLQPIEGTLRSPRVFHHDSWGPQAKGAESGWANQDRLPH